jgi:hypothetical protein
VLILLRLLTCALVVCGVYWVMVVALFVQWAAVGAPFGDVPVEDQPSTAERWLAIIVYGTPGIAAILVGVLIWRIAGRRFATPS